MDEEWIYRMKALNNIRKIALQKAVKAEREVRMMNIKPLEEHMITYFHIDDSNKKVPLFRYYQPKDVRKLEADYKLSLIALYNSLIDLEFYYNLANTETLFIEAYKIKIAIIEKATGQSWEEITK